MTSVIRYGKGATLSYADLSRIGEQVSDRKHGGVVAVTAALQDTTDLIARAIYLSNAAGGESHLNQHAEAVFRHYEQLASQIGDRNLGKFLNGVYREYDSRLSSRRTRRENERLLALPARLTAHLLHAYLVQSGINSSVADIGNPDFPLRLSPSHATTEIDMEASRRAASRLKPEGSVIVVPGYAGVHANYVRTLGRGGSDTAAFVLGYAFNADTVWIVAGGPLTTAPGMHVPDAETVREIDLSEAEAAGFFGARLQTERSAEPLTRFFEENPGGEVYITGKDMGPDATRIRPGAESRPVKFIACRPVERYGIQGDIDYVYANLCRIPADWFVFGGKGRRLGIGVSGDPALVRHVLEDAVLSERARVTYSDDATYIGVVGSGMKGVAGIGKRASLALGGIDILGTYDPTVTERESGTMGIVVAREDEKKAVQALHREFFGST